MYKEIQPPNKPFIVTVSALSKWAKRCKSATINFKALKVDVTNEPVLQETGRSKKCRRVATDRCISTTLVYFICTWLQAPTG